jgi:hypothetical protein
MHNIDTALHCIEQQNPNYGTATDASPTPGSQGASSLPSPGRGVDQKVGQKWVIDPLYKALNTSPLHREVDQVDHLPAYYIISFYKEN